jgi:SAM-dependent methyltransferase
LSSERIAAAADLPDLLDALLAGQAPERWDDFYADRARPCPFFVDAPDESLVQWLHDTPVPPARALDLGCGHGRNTRHLARQGHAVIGVDYAPAAIAWAEESTRGSGLPIEWHCRSAFDLDLPAGHFDLVYDSGCFHHIAPHRRPGYVQRVAMLLRPGGWFGLTCFRPEGGSGLTDLQVYEQRTLGGGLGFTEAQLRAIWSAAFEIVQLRPMIKPPPGSGLFGEPFLWAMWGRRHGV